MRRDSNTNICTKVNIIFQGIQNVVSSPRDCVGPRVEMEYFRSQDKRDESGGITKQTDIGEPSGRSYAKPRTAQLRQTAEVEASDDEESKDIIVLGPASDDEEVKSNRRSSRSPSLLDITKPLK